MLLLGLLLLGASGAFAGLLIADNRSGGPDYSATILGHHLATMNSLSIFVAGLALALVFSLGLAMMAGGGTLARRRRSALREARASAPADDRPVADRDAFGDRNAFGGQNAFADRSAPGGDDTADEPTTVTTKPATHRHRHRLHFGH